MSGLPGDAKGVTELTTTTTDRPIHLISPSAPHGAVNAPTPFIPQKATVREITERPVTRDELKAYRETVLRAHRMIENALEKLIGA